MEFRILFIQTTYKNKHKDKTFFFKIYLILAVLSLRCCPGAFSSCSEQRLLSSCGAQASDCGGFIPWRAQALGGQASLVVARGL